MSAGPLRHVQALQRDALAAVGVRHHEHRGLGQAAVHQLIQSVAVTPATLIQSCGTPGWPWMSSMTGNR